MWELDFLSFFIAHNTIHKKNIKIYYPTKKVFSSKHTSVVILNVAMSALHRCADILPILTEDCDGLPFLLLVQSLEIECSVPSG